MAKLKKGERVRTYLEKLVQTDGFVENKLMDLKPKDIIYESELFGIGERTILNALNELKEKLLPEETKDNRISKKIKVREFLEKRYLYGRSETDVIRKIRYKDLANEPELKRVGKTTITCALSEFKKEFIETYLSDEPDFQVEFKKEKAENVARKPKLEIESSDLATLKTMIHTYQLSSSMNLDYQFFELKELKMALHYMGIDHKKLLRAYWEDVTQFRLMRCI